MTQRLSYLDFLGCEVTHDKLLLQSYLTMNNMQTIINNVARGCDLNQGINTYDTNSVTTAPSTLYPTSYFSSNMVVGENYMVELMFTRNKNNLIQYLTAVGPQMINTQQTNDTAGAHARTITGIPVSMAFWPYDHPGTPTDITTWTNIFAPVTDSLGQKHVYFVCDSASHFIGRMSLTSSLPANTNIHCMFSSATYGDPSSLIRPDSANIIQPLSSASCNKYTHECNNPINSRACDKLTMLDMRIAHVMTPASKNVDETLHFNTPALNIHFPNAAAGTSKTQIKATMNTVHNASDKFRIAQGKRLGDHNQIRFAKYLQNYAPGLPPNHTFTSTQVTPGPVVIPPLTCSPNNVFFVTQDWPAFCFAVFNKINSILVTVKPKGFLVAYVN
jgi:hypothetical protein